MIFLCLYFYKAFLLFFPVKSFILFCNYIVFKLKYILYIVNLYQIFRNLFFFEKYNFFNFIVIFLWFCPTNFTFYLRAFCNENPLNSVYI